MPRLRYVGPFDEVDIPALGVVVKRGESFDVGAENATELLTQAENFADAKRGGDHSNDKKNEES